MLEPDDELLDHEKDDDDDDDDELVLSAASIAALSEFERTRLLDANEFAVVEAKARTSEDLLPTSTVSEESYRALFKEDWNLSQFWYDTETSLALAREVERQRARIPGGGGRVAFIASPTAYHSWTSVRGPGAQAVLLEVDDRFRLLVHGDEDRFIHYDYRTGLSAAEAERIAPVHVILLDPPFLTAECHERVSRTVRQLARAAVSGGSTPADDLDVRLIIASGAVVEEHLARLYAGLRCTQLRPRHQGGRLSNDFRVWVNYEGEGEWAGRPVTM